MKRILKKYSNNKLADLTGLPLSWITGYRKRIFINSMLRGIADLIQFKVRKFEVQNER